VKPKRVRLGDLLLDRKLISEEQLADALKEQQVTGRKLGRVFIDMGVISEAELHGCLAEHLQIPFVDLAHLSIDPKTVRLLPETHARRYRALVLKEDGKGVLVGMADPTDIFAFDELSRLIGKPLRLAVVQETALLRAIDLTYRRTDEIVSLAEEVDEDLSSADLDVDALAADEGSSDAPVVRLIQSMFHDAVRMSASDIHIEPEEQVLRIRQRVDGMLQEQIIDGHRVGQALVTRLKLMCGIDISEKRKPQDGRFSIRVDEVSLDVRVSTMPIYGGEAVVLRLLDQASARLSFEDLGMPADIIGRFTSLIERPAGLVLVTGPTGSGKTTTLYSALEHVNTPMVKIITAEDPVEYRLARINQVQINPRIGLDFATVLRTALRHDPDIVLVGEMRDRETVEMGLRASMTGHLVFSTLHTINAIATVNRLVDMGAEGYMIASALHAVLAQRLIRRNCTSCAEPVELTPQQRSWVTAQNVPGIDEQTEFRHGQGCTYCNMTGYRGRVGIYELLEIDAALADAIRRTDLAQFATLARNQAGFVSLTHRALANAAAHLTSIDEVMRVTIGLGDRDGGSPLIDDVLASETRRNRTG
jgi:MSHA biogenesis protein MshE